MGRTVDRREAQTEAAATALEWQQSFRELDAKPKGITIELLRVEFEKLEVEYGDLTPEIIIRAATPEDSPLHPLYEWNNDVAAHKFRLWQARHHQGRVKQYRIETGTYERVRESVLVSVVTESGEVRRERAYKRVDEILADPDLKAQLYNQFLAHVRYWAGKLKRLEGYNRNVDSALTLFEEILSSDGEES